MFVLTVMTTIKQRLVVVVVVLLLFQWLFVVVPCLILWSHLDPVDCGVR